MNNPERPDGGQETDPAAATSASKEALVASVKAELLPEITFTANTTFEHFSYWLEQRTLDAPRHPFVLVPPGQLILQVARPTDRWRVTMKADYMGAFKADGKSTDRPTDPDVQEVIIRPMGEPIEFAVVPLASERIQVRARCNLPRLATYYASLLVGIAEAWPEAGEGILRGLGHPVSEGDSQGEASGPQAEGIVQSLGHPVPGSDPGQAEAGDSKGEPGEPQAPSETILREGKPEEAPRPYECISNSMGREMVRLWTEEEKTSVEIGDMLKRSPKTVLNRLSDLRQAYGEGVVPSRRNRPKRR